MVSTIVEDSNIEKTLLNALEYIRCFFTNPKILNDVFFENETIRIKSQNTVFFGI